jgi:hypothetical protein
MCNDSRFVLVCVVCSWFVAHASRGVAEQLLTLAVPQSFLVRPSSQAGSYALSMTDEHGSLIHAAIQQNAHNHYYISGAPDPYPTIAQRMFTIVDVSA